MNDVLLTVSGVIDPEIEENIARGERPEADYVAMARTFDADLIDYTAARQNAGWFGRLLEKIGGPNLLLAWACFRLRDRYRVLFTDGEQVGLPLALLLKFASFGDRPAHLMITHILSVRKKMIVIDWLRPQSHIDLFFVYATRQKQFIEARWGVPADRVVYTPFMVDADFFAPERLGDEDPLGLDGQTGQLISAVGLEFRDYPTLIKAVRGLDVHVMIAAASPWSKRSDSTAGEDIPENVTVRSFSQYDLRYLYATSQFFVMPLYENNFQAGVTSILEAMAMEKAIICSRTTGQTDVLNEGQTGMYVPPEDPEALRKAIVYLLDNPLEAEKMGKRGRQYILQEMSLELYVRRLNEFARQAQRV